MNTPPALHGMQFVKVLHVGETYRLLAYETTHTGERTYSASRWVVRVWDPEVLPAANVRVAAANLQAHANQRGVETCARIQSALVDPAGRLVVVQQYVSGPSLRASIFQRKFGLAEALALGVEMTTALGSVHRTRCHLRVTPSAVRYSKYEVPRPTKPMLVGLDLAEVVERAGRPAWDSPWASPRQRAGVGRPTTADDLFGVAAIVYSMLTAELPPVRAKDWPQFVRPDVPTDVWDLLRSTMFPRRLVRPLTAQHLVDRLGDIEEEMFGYRTGGDDYRPSAAGPRYIQPTPQVWIEPVNQSPQQPPVVRPAGDPPGGPYPRIGFR